MTGGTPALTVDSLEAGYEKGLPIVRGASLTLQRGEIFALIGPNGAGKSSLVKAIAGLLPITGGRIMLEGKDITRIPAHRMIFEGLAFVPQTDNVFINLSVAENLELAAAIVRKNRRESIDPIYALFPDLLETTRKTGAVSSAPPQGLASSFLPWRRAAAPFALPRQRSTLAGLLSGGQRQMLAVARALIALPKLLILDEPTAGLSPKMAGHLFDKLRDVRATGVTILMVEQNVKAALALADRAAVLVEGKERIVAPCPQLFDDPRIAELYLGRIAKERPE